MNTQILMVLDVLAKSLGVLLFAAALQSLWRKTSAAQRCLVWLAAFSVLLLLPLTVIMKPVWTVKVPDRAPPPRVLHELPVMQSMPMIPDDNMAPLPVAEPAWQMPQLSLWQWLGLAWLTGVCVLLLRRVAGAWQLRRLYKESFACETPRISALAIRLASEVGVQRRVDLRLSSKVTVPLTWGFIKPVLLLPADATEWPEAPLHAALCHELGHIRHWDALSRLLMTVLCALQWPNALLWLAAKSWRTAQEQACDDLVLNSGASKEAYAMQLLESARSVQRLGFLHAALTMAQPSTLETRLSAIMDPTRDRRPVRRKALFTGFAGALSALVLCAALQVRAESKTDGDGVAGANGTQPPELWFEIRRIEFTNGAKPPVKSAGITWHHPPIVLDAAKLKDLLSELKGTEGVKIGSCGGGYVQSGQNQNSTLTEPVVNAEGKEEQWTRIQYSECLTETGSGINVKFKAIENDKNVSVDGKPLPHTAEADQIIQPGQTLLMSCDPTVINGKTNTLVYLFTAQHAVFDNRLLLHGDRVESSDPAHQTGKVSGQARIEVSDESKQKYEGKADAVEFDLSKKQAILRGHPEILVVGSHRHYGTADDTWMVIHWDGPKVRRETHGPAKTDILPEASAKVQPLRSAASVESPFKNVEISGQETNFDPASGIATAKGHVEVKVTTSANPPVIYRGKADALEYDSNKKEAALHGHAEIADSATGDFLSFDDKDIIIKWDTPVGSWQIRAVKKKEAVVQGPDKPAMPIAYFTIFGQVQRQGKYELAANENLTLTQALLRAGGPTDTAKMKKVHVVRRTGEGKNVTINVNADDVMKNGNLDKDILIRPNDVVIVDERIMAGLGPHDAAKFAEAKPGPVRAQVLMPDPHAAIERISDMTKLDDTTPLRVGDLVSFRIVEDHDRVLSLRVQQSGDLQTPHLGLVKAAGLTCKKVAYEVKQHLEKNLFEKATVIIVIEYRGEPKAYLAGNSAASPQVTEFDGFIDFGSPVEGVAADDSGKPGTVVLTPTLDGGKVLVLTNTVEDPKKSAAQTKADGIIIPDVLFKEATVDEALEFLRVKAKELDPEGKGVSILLKVGPQSPARTARLTMDLHTIPLSEALRYVAGLANLEIKAEDSALILQELGKKDTAALPKGTLEISGGTLTLDHAAAPSPASTKANQIILPTVSFKDATVDEALDFLRVKSKELDPTKEGLNIVLKAGPKAHARDARMTMDLRDVPLSEALHYVAELADLELVVEDHGMILREKAAVDLAKLPDVKVTGFDLLDSPTLAKAKKIILPQVDFEATTDVNDAVSFLSNKGKELDADKEGVKIILYMTPGHHLLKSSLNFKNVPLSETLRYVAYLAQFDIRVDDKEHAIILQERMK